jgi:hypothetical protein
MTPERIAEIAAITNAATPGPAFPVQVCNWWMVQDGPNYDDNRVLDSEECDRAEGNAVLFSQASVIVPELLDEVKRAPGWHERPTGPGLWVCMPDLNAFPRLTQIIGLELDQEDIDRGAPFNTLCVFGPIPADSKEGV